MPKYIDTEDLRNAMYQETFEKDSEMQKWESGCWIRYKLFENVLNAMPAADVVEVEMLKKNIEANLDEAKKLRDEHSSELIRAFQQGRMFGHECDLEMIKRKETE